METTTKTAKEIYLEGKANPVRKRIGFGNKAVLVNIDLQKAYTRTDLFATAYETDPNQLDYVNRLVAKFRALQWPVVWTHVAYMESGEDAGVWGTRTNTEDSLQNIKVGSPRAELDQRLDEVMDTLADPAGTFYRFSMAHSILHRARTTNGAGPNGSPLPKDDKKGGRA